MHNTNHFAIVPVIFNNSVIVALMIRLFRHYFSRTFITLLVAEMLHLFWSI